MCDGCTGPGLSGCIGCVENAHWDPRVEECACNKGYTGEDCSDYIGECPQLCAACTNDTDCVSCIDNAIVNADGQCVCIDGLKGDDCTEIDCHPICDPTGSCTGLRPFDCERCNDNAKVVPSDFPNMCECKSGYTGKGCETYAGVCNPICATCDGPTEYDCQTCVTNASLDPMDGLCYCHPNWIGYACHEWWEGYCDEKCELCDHGLCLECVGNAELIDDAC